jgi:hypothetical protein
MGTESHVTSQTDEAILTGWIRCSLCSAERSVQAVRAVWKRRMVDNSARPSSVPASPPGYRHPQLFRPIHLTVGEVTLQINKGCYAKRINKGCYAKLGGVNHAFPGKRGLSEYGT